MPQFELGGSVSMMNSDPVFSSSFAKEVAKESSILTSDSVYKSSFATELLETSVNSSVIRSEVQQQDDSNIYENINYRENIENQPADPTPFLDDSSDFRRLSQVKEDHD